MKKYIAICLIALLLLILGFAIYYFAHGQMVFLRPKITNSNQGNLSSVPDESFKIVPSSGKIGDEITIYSDQLTPTGNEIQLIYFDGQQSSLNSFGCKKISNIGCENIYFENLSSVDLKSLKFKIPEKGYHMMPGKYGVIVYNGQGKVVSPDLYQGSSTANVFFVTKSELNDFRTIMGVVERDKTAKPGCEFSFGNQVESSRNFINHSWGEFYEGKDVVGLIKPISGTANCPGEFMVYSLAPREGAYGNIIQVPRGSSPDMKSTIGDFTINYGGKSIRVKVDKLKSINYSEKKEDWTRFYENSTAKVDSLTISTKKKEGIIPAWHLYGSYIKIDEEKKEYIFQVEDILMSVG